jgi:hypothetical protein
LIAPCSVFVAGFTGCVVGGGRGVVNVRDDFGVDGDFDDTALLVLQGLDTLDADEPVIVAWPDQSHALRVAAEHGDLATGVRTSVPADVINMISSVQRHLQSTDHAAVALGGSDADHALTAATLYRELLDRRQLTVAVLGREQDRTLVEDPEPDDLVLRTASRRPRTPAAVRPIGRTSSSEKRIALPELANSMMSCGRP